MTALVLVYDENCKKRYCKSRVICYLAVCCDPIFCVPSGTFFSLLSATFVEGQMCQQDDWLTVITSDSASSIASENRLTAFRRDILTCSLNVPLDYWRICDISLISDGMVALLQPTCKQLQACISKTMVLILVSWDLDKWLPIVMLASWPSWKFAEKNSSKSTMVTIIAMYSEDVAKNSSLDPEMFRTQ